MVQAYPNQGSQVDEMKLLENNSNNTTARNMFTPTNDMIVQEKYKNWKFITFKNYVDF